MSEITRDLRTAVRLLLRDRVFAAAALVTLALCTGANAALFSVVHSVLVRPLPFAEPNELVAVYNSYPHAGVQRAGNGGPDFVDRQALPAFAELAIWQDGTATIGDAGSAERVAVLRASGSLLPLLGVGVERGRNFSEEEALPGGPRVVILSHGLWQERFAGRADAIGETLRINGNTFEVIGVLPRGFRFGGDARLLTPLTLTAEQTADDNRHSNNFEMVGRLAPGATVATARAQIHDLNRRNDERFPHLSEVIAQAGFTTHVERLHDDLTGDVRATLLLLQAGVLIVLLIGCVNIANLLLVRATARAREWATRSALGAAFPRLARQLLTESVLLASVGAALGLGLGYAALRAFATYAVEHVPRGAEITMSAPVVAATAALALLAGIAFGLLPIARLRGTDLSTVFREDARSSTASRSAIALRGGLVVAQVALAFALLSGAGLTLASFLRTTSTDPGFRRDGVLTASVALPTLRYADEEARLRFFETLLDQINAQPGITRAALASAIPFGSGMTSSVVTAEGRRTRAGEPPAVPWISSVTPGYFEALGMPILRGRAFEPSDHEHAVPVVIIDESLARQLWPDEDAVGRRVFIGAYEIGEPEESLVMRTVVGIVREARVTGLTGDGPAGQFYLPFAQQVSGGAHIVARTAVEPLSLVPAMRRVLGALDAELPLHDVKSMEQRVSASLANERARAILIVGFAGLALLLAAVGLYGVLAYTVAQRSTEIGIRLALGSSNRNIFRLVVRQGLGLVALGVAVGGAVSFAAARFMESLLHGVTLGEPAVHASVIALLVIVAAAACLVPAVRAARLDPAIALRR